MTFEMITLSKQMVSTAWFHMLIVCVCVGGGGEAETNIEIVLAFRTLSMFVSVSLP